MRLHYLQHVAFENPGTILDWAGKNNHAVTCTMLYNGEELPVGQEFDWLVVMGGPMNIYEEAEYPWLADEKRFIKNAIESGKVVLGLCLGAQLIADALGGEVTRNPDTEIGWFPVKLTEDAKDLEVFRDFPDEITVFEWHGDTFALPEETVWLAGNKACKNQAFSYKDRVFGFQFHLENTLEIINALIENCADEMVSGDYIQSPMEILSHPECIENDNRLMDVFLTRLEKLHRKEALDAAYKV